MLPFFFFSLISLILSGKTIETTTAETCSAQAELDGFQQDFGILAVLHSGTRTSTRWCSFFKNPTLLCLMRKRQETVKVQLHFTCANIFNDTMPKPFDYKTMKKNTLKDQICLGTSYLNTSLWPVTSCQSSQGHIKGALRLVSQDDAHHGKVLGSQGSLTAVLQQWQWVSGCWVCGAAAACPMRRHGSRALVCSGELHPTPFMSYKGCLQNCVMETELLLPECQTGCGKPGVNFFEPITEELAQMGSRQI